LAIRWQTIGIPLQPQRDAFFMPTFAVAFEMHPNGGEGALPTEWKIKQLNI
jgi:hypothetical protein